jgi:hypothetical protein
MRVDCGIAVATNPKLVSCSSTHAGNGSSTCVQLTPSVETQVSAVLVRLLD